VILPQNNHKFRVLFFFRIDENRNEFFFLPVSPKFHSTKKIASEFVVSHRIPNNNTWNFFNGCQPVFSSEVA